MLGLKLIYARGGGVSGAEDIQLALIANYPIRRQNYKFMTILLVWLYLINYGYR